MLRDHSPLKPSTMLTMFMIGTFMDEDGFTFVGQGRIAKGARASARSVQRHIESARRLGWLHVELVRVKSKQNAKVTFMNNYRATVPADLELPEKDEELRDFMLSRVGDIDVGDDTALASPSWAPDTDGDDNQSRRTRQPERKVTTFTADGDDTALAQEVFSSKSSFISNQYQGALPRPDTVDKSDETFTAIADVLAARSVADQDEEVLQEKAAPRPPMPQPEPKPPPRPMEERIAAALALSPNISDVTLAKMIRGATVEQIAAVRAGVAA